MNNKRQLLMASICAFAVSFTPQSFADQSGDLTKECTQRQMSAHKGLKKSLTENEFQPYCACVSKTIEESLSPNQLNEWNAKGADKKPVWFLNAQKSAEKMCLAGKPKIST